MSIKLEQAARQAVVALVAERRLWAEANRESPAMELAITALREALDHPEREWPSGGESEQAEQHIDSERMEPVAWGRIFDGDIIDCICPEEHALNEGDYTIPLYAAPVRTKDLTDDAIDDIALESGGDLSGNSLVWFSFHDYYKFARAVIAADREKNK